MKKAIGAINMEDLLKISSTPQETIEYLDEHWRYPSLDSQFVTELTRRVREAKGLVYHQIAPLPPDLPGYELQHGPISPAEVLVALGSAGIFTTVYQL
jgi:hypothetical protein